MSSPPIGSSPNLPSSPARSRDEEALFVTSSPPESSNETLTPSTARNLPPDSSPLSLGSSPQMLPSSTLSSSLRSDRDYTRSLGSSRTRSRRGELGTASDPSQVSELGSDPVRVIWGTTVQMREVSDMFKTFLSGFKPRFRMEYDHTPFEPGQGEDPVYMDELEKMRQLGTTDLAVDAQDIRAYSDTTKLYHQLVNYPTEVIPLMDQALKEHIAALAESQHQNATEELNEIEARQYRTRPYGLEAKKGLRELNPTDIDKLVTIKGLVLRATPIIPEMVDAFFKCAVCNHTVVAEIDKGLITEPTRCPRQACGQINSMQLVHNRCKFSDKQVIKLQETPDVIPDGQTPHTVSICVYDDLVDYCRAGDRVEVTGMFRGTGVRANPIQRVLKNLFKTFVDAVHIRKDNPKRMGVDTSTRDDEDKVLSEQEISEIKEMAERPDVYDVLSRSLAPSIFENQDVKKGILLQLFGGTNKTFEKGGKPRYRGDINVLLCGDPSTSKSQLLTYVHRIAPRGMYTSGKGSSAVGLTAYITKDTETKQLVLESGALVLSDGGICCIDEFDKMSDATRSVLHEVMEQQTVSIAKAGIITTLNARTSILASANPIGSRYDTNLSVVQNIDLPPTLLSRFDLVYLMLDKVNPESDRSLAHHLTSMYLNDKPESGATEEIVSIEFLSNYVSYAKKNFHPKITKEASEMFTEKYLEMRNLDPNEPNQLEKRITATTRQLESMIRLSEAHAKMRLSHTVELEDVEEASRLINRAILKYAMDPLTGKIDMDLVQTGHSRAQRQTYEKYKDAIMSYLESSNTGTAYDAVLTTMNNTFGNTFEPMVMNRALADLQRENLISINSRRIISRNNI